MSDGDEMALLSDGAAAALLAFFEERCVHHGTEETTSFTENWNLSQFWYTEETADVICEEMGAALEQVSSPRVACISCPTIIRRCLKRGSTMPHTLFEYDSRFASLGDFVHYDYKEPEKIDPSLRHAFDAVIADPPYLSEECLVKTLVTAKLLLKEEAKHRLYLLTGAVMKDIAFREASLRPVTFRPQHENKLGNAFLLYTTQDTLFHIGPFDAGPW